MQHYFAELSDIMIYQLESFQPDNVGRLFDYTCYPWVFGNFCLFGNGAHQIFPYFGQGLNAGLEDCTVLMELLDEKEQQNWQQVTKKFQAVRKPNTDAISLLSKANFEGLKKQMWDEEYQERKFIINYLSENYEELFISQYQMIEFSHIDFAKARSFSRVEDEIVKQIRMIPGYLGIIENNKRESIIRQILRNFVGKYEVEASAVEIIS